MKFKTTKKETPKKLTQQKEVIEKEPKDVGIDKKETLSKEEIKELVEETVEESLKEHEEKAEITSEQGEVDSASSSNIQTAKKDKEENKNDEVSPVIPLPTSVSLESTSSMNIEAKAPEVPVEPTKPSETTDNQTALDSKATPVVSISGATPNTDKVPVTSQSVPQKNKSSLLILFVVFVICGIIVGVSILYLLSKNNFTFHNATSIIKQVSTPSPTLVATPTSKPVDISKYTIRVLNGSGVAGAAAQEKTDLAAVGFSVTSTGNAPNTTTETTVAAKPSVDQKTLSKLVQALAAKYTVASNISPLADSESTDIVVTIGVAK